MYICFVIFSSDGKAVLTLMEIMEVDADDGEKRTLQKYISVYKNFFTALAIIQFLS